jgi:tetratricopeptide (TPR) repeat protein
MPCAPRQHFPELFLSNAEVAKLVTRFARAREAAARSAASEPDNVNAQATAAQTFTLAGAHELALMQWRKAAALAPENAAVWSGLAAAQQNLGDIDGAIGSLRRAIAADPNNAYAYYALTATERQTVTENHIAALERIFAIPDSDGMNSLQAGHALAKTYEDLRNLPKSFEWLGRAKRIRGRSHVYDLERNRLAADAAMELARGPANGFASQEPIFIVGLPRTGTSLVDRIVSNHPEVSSAGELTNFSELMKAIAQTGPAFTFEAVTLNAAKNIDVAALGKAYVESTRPITGSTPHFIDKAPINYMLAGLIHRALPNARIICLVREPMDACLSLYRQMIPTNNWYYDYIYRLEDTAKAYAVHRKVVAHWREKLPADRFMEIRYEDIVADLEGQTRKLIAFCGLDWDERCLSFHENRSAITTPSAAQVRQPIYASSIGRWKKYGALLDPLRTALRAEGFVIED